MKKLFVVLAVVAFCSSISFASAEKNEVRASSDIKFVTSFISGIFSLDSKTDKVPETSIVVRATGDADTYFAMIPSADVPAKRKHNGDCIFYISLTTQHGKRLITEIYEHCTALTANVELTKLEKSGTLVKPYTRGQAELAIIMNWHPKATITSDEKLCSLILLADKQFC